MVTQQFTPAAPRPIAPLAAIGLILVVAAVVFAAAGTAVADWYDCDCNSCWMFLGQTRIVLSERNLTYCTSSQCYVWRNTCTGGGNCQSAGWSCEDLPSQSCSVLRCTP